MRENSPTHNIADEERRKRQEAVNYARASVGLEGFKPSHAAEAHAPASSLVKSTLPSSSRPSHAEIVLATDSRTWSAGFVTSRRLMPRPRFS